MREEQNKIKGQLTFENEKYTYTYRRGNPKAPDLPKAKEIFEKVAWLMVEYDLMGSDNQALREAMGKRNGFSVRSDEEIVSALNSLVLYSGFPSNGVMNDKNTHLKMSLEEKRIYFSRINPSKDQPKRSVNFMKRPAPAVKWELLLKKQEQEKD